MRARSVLGPHPVEYTSKSRSKGNHLGGLGRPPISVKALCNNFRVSKSSMGYYKQPTYEAEPCGAPAEAGASFARPPRTTRSCRRAGLRRHQGTLVGTPEILGASTKSGSAPNTDIRVRSILPGFDLTWRLMRVSS